MLPNMDLLMAPVSISLLEFISNQQNKALMYSMSQSNVAPKIKQTAMT